MAVRLVHRHGPSVSRLSPRREKLDIDTTVRIRIGTAGGASFLTDGVATVKLPIIDVKGHKHILEIRAHVADIGKKCLVNTAGLARQGLHLRAWR